MIETSRSDDSTTAGDRTGARGPLGRKSKVGGIAVIVLVAVYSFAAPELNSRFGWNLPQIKADGNGNVRLAEEADNAAGESDAKPAAAIVEKKSAEDADHDLLYGILREVSRDRYISAQGLMYTPGSAEGHRLEHLRRHTKDDPGRPGSHGVFDGEMAGALKTIDRAYERAKKGHKTTKKEDDGRTIYTVDMGSRIGFVGGRDGKRKRNPMARRVRIVLDGNRVITAYPM